MLFFNERNELAESVNFWPTVLTELKNRGVEEILVACIVFSHLSVVFEKPLQNIL